jgi:pyridoxal phosphate enzyme (YggS family)
VAYGSRDQILENLASIRTGIARAADRSGRDPAQLTLVAVAKTVPVVPVRWVVDAGVEDVGENYVQELRAKAQAVPNARWHFIGTLQTNSAHHVAAHAAVVHSVTGGRATERLARRAAGSGRTLDALVEVDFTSERTGVHPSDLPSLVDRVARLEGLRLIGLMTLPPLSESPEDARSSFVRLRRLRDRIREKHPDVLALSMGMSLDYEVAVEEGATIVRIGTALFGPRM